MKNFIKNTIIKQALELGFDFEQFTDNDDLESVNEELLNFFIENSHLLEQLEDECEVEGNGSRQYVEHGDYRCDGEIVDFSSYWHESPDTKVYHSDYIFEDKDGLIKNMKLYYLVGVTDINQ